ncbi:CsgG/HfaB family protein [Pseudoalteromonas sp. KAN5]|uniref:CsgG/HfaB family protein n=1 Tax=Pseudoalteromonas sp. KAN5 TaxID=2916633 RepID=UPI001FCC1098|nr:CsgG/HfaB family protein [Pseudoalteromonas sp. KAN5]BDF93704.1 hypothetical protein KAN5_05420 [Pseudoalteromonas sp. KAN5]
MKTGNLIALAISSAILSGCVSTDTKTTTKVQTNGVKEVRENEHGEEITVVKTLRCPSPVAKITISPMKCKSSQCQEDNYKGNGFAAMVQTLAKKESVDFSLIGESMTTMMTSSLSQTGCFDVLDREVLEDLRQEMALAGKTIEVDTSDFIVTGAITSLEYAKEESSFGGGLIPFGGAVTNSETTAKIGLDVRVLDVNSSKIVYTKTYKSDASNDNYGFGLFGAGSGGIAGGGMSFGGSLEMEEAIRHVLNNAVSDFIKSTASGRYEEVETIIEES